MSWYDEPEPFITQAEYEEAEHARHCDGCPECDPHWHDAPHWAEREYQIWAAMHRERAS